MQVPVLVEYSIADYKKILLCKNDKTNASVRLARLDNLFENYQKLRMCFGFTAHPLRTKP